MPKPGELLVDQPFYKEYERLATEYFAKYPMGRIQTRSVRNLSDPDHSEHRRSWVFLRKNDGWVYNDEMTRLRWEQCAWLRDGLCGGQECQTPVELGRFWCDSCAIDQIKKTMDNMRQRMRQREETDGSIECPD